MSRPTGGGGTSKSVGGMSGAGMSSSVTQHTAVDPTEAEEEVMKGRITFALTAHKEVRCFGRSRKKWWLARSSLVGVGDDGDYGESGCAGGRFG